jgi:hypothetical protein
MVIRWHADEHTLLPFCHALQKAFLLSVLRYQQGWLDMP